MSEKPSPGGPPPEHPPSWGAHNFRCALISFMTEPPPGETLADRFTRWVTERAPDDVARLRERVRDFFDPPTKRG